MLSIIFNQSNIEKLPSKQQQQQKKTKRFEHKTYVVQSHKENYMQFKQLHLFFFIIYLE